MRMLIIPIFLDKLELEMLGVIIVLNTKIHSSVMMRIC